MRPVVAPLLGAGADEVVQVADETSDVVLGRVEVASGTGWVSMTTDQRIQLEKVVGDLDSEDARDAVVLVVSG